MTLSNKQKAIKALRRDIVMEEAKLTHLKQLLASVSSASNIWSDYLSQYNLASTKIYMYQKRIKFINEGQGYLGEHIQNQTMLKK